MHVLRIEGSLGKFMPRCVLTITAVTSAESHRATRERCVYRNTPRPSHGRAGRTHCGSTWRIDGTASNSTRSAGLRQVRGELCPYQKDPEGCGITRHSHQERPGWSSRSARPHRHVAAVIGRKAGPHHDAPHRQPWRRRRRIFAKYQSAAATSYHRT